MKLVHRETEAKKGGERLARWQFIVSKLIIVIIPLQLVAAIVIRVVLFVNSKLIASFVCHSSTVQLLTVFLLLPFLSLFSSPNVCCLSFILFSPWIQVITKWIHKSGCFLGSRSKANDECLFAFTLFFSTRSSRNGKRKRLLFPPLQVCSLQLCRCFFVHFYFFMCLSKKHRCLSSFHNPIHHTLFAFFASVEFVWIFVEQNEQQHRKQQEEEGTETKKYDST